MIKTFKKGWHVLYVKSCQENKVHTLLQEKKIKSFLPIVKNIKQWSDRKKITFKPLFPSYVFVKAKNSLEFYEALSVPGASAYIRFGSEYATVKNYEIDKIKIFNNTEGASDIKVINNPLKVGEIKKINSGPLKGIECEILKVGSNRKIIVRIDSLRQNIIATFSNHYLDKLEIV